MGKTLVRNDDLVAFYEQAKIDALNNLNSKEQALNKLAQSGNLLATQAQSTPKDFDEILQLMDETRIEVEHLALEDKVNERSSFGQIRKNAARSIFEARSELLLELIRTCSQYRQHASHLLGSKFRFDVALKKAESVYQISQTVLKK